MKDLYPTPKSAHVVKLDPNLAYSPRKSKCFLVATIIQLYRFSKAKSNPLLKPLGLVLGVLCNLPDPALAQPRIQEGKHSDEVVVALDGLLYGQDVQEVVYVLHCLTPRVVDVARALDDVKVSSLLVSNLCRGVVVEFIKELGIGAEPRGSVNDDGERLNLRTPISVDIVLILHPTLEVFG